MMPRMERALSQHEKSLHLHQQHLRADCRVGNVTDDGSGESCVVPGGQAPWRAVRCWAHSCPVFSLSCLFCGTVELCQTRVHSRNLGCVNLVGACTSFQACVVCVPGEANPEQAPSAPGSC